MTGMMNSRKILLITLNGRRVFKEELLSSIKPLLRHISSSSVSSSVPSSSFRSSSSQHQRHQPRVQIPAQISPGLPSSSPLLVVSGRKSFSSAHQWHSHHKCGQSSGLFWWNFAWGAAAGSALLVVIGSYQLLPNWRFPLWIVPFPRVHAAKVVVPNTESPEEGGGKSTKFYMNFIADVVEQVTPAVVFIDAVGKLPFFGEQSVSSGSGFIVRSDGYILTNAHVVEGVRGRTLRVHLHDGTVHQGHVTYMDTTGDLALVRINAKDLPAMKLGDSSKSRPGEWVIALGSPFSLTNSVTMGIISSVKRPGSDLGLDNTVNYIQTDALITFGNSGGPLVNLAGEAIGINSMKVTDGISFAIPSDYAKDFLNQCAELEERKGRSAVTWPFTGSDSKKKAKEDHHELVRPGAGRRRIGITMMQLDAQTTQTIRGYDPSFPDVSQGVLVHTVVIGQPAFESGIRPGDVITHLNGRVVRTSKDLLDAVEASAKLRLRIIRKTKIFELEVIPTADDT